jgi:hypothetical protein
LKEKHDVGNNVLVLCVYLRAVRFHHLEQLEMRRALSGFAALVAVHVVLFWLLWAAGFDFTERGQTMFWFAYLGLGFGGLAAVITYQIVDGIKDE